MNGSFWLELFIRSGCVLLAGAALYRLCKPLSARFRHKVLLGSLASVAFLPLLSIFLPEISLPLWTSAHQGRGSVTIQENSTAVGTSPAHHIDWLFLVWLAGFLTAVTPLVAGYMVAWRMVRQARPLNSGPLVCAALSVPVTVGLFRARILFPAEAEYWPPARLEAVIAHEQAHIRRRDLLVQTAAHLLAALWWFQPLLWLFRQKLRAESELACDAEALRCGLRASVYASELLAVAHSIGKRQPFCSGAISMARSCGLELRLQAVLAVQPAAASRRTISLIAIVLATVAIAASASNLNTGGSTMKRTFVSALLTSAGLSAASVSGSVQDASGAPVSDARVLVYNPDTGAKQEALTGADGRFALPETPAGEYILRVEKAGFVSLFREYDLQQGGNIDRTFKLIAGNERIANEEPDSETGQKSIRIGGAIAEANLLKRVAPVYPPSAKAAAVEGSVSIEATISKEGVPVELRVVSSPSADLSQSALEAVRQWRYRPTLLNGEPVQVVAQISINYSLAK